MTYRNDYREFEREVFWTAPKVVFGGLILIFLLYIAMVACNVVSLPLWFANRSVDVVKEQIDPQEVLRKYELFKDEAARLDAKVADIKIKQAQVKTLGSDLKSMDRTNREQYMIWQQELEGMKFSYNALAADYNAQMSKINYRFTNVGDLPKGATEVLPREYRQYQEE